MTRNNFAHCIILGLLLASSSGAQLKAPVEPLVPDIALDDEITGARFSAVVFFASGQSEEGTAAFFSDRILCGAKTILLAKIRGIEILKWKGVARGKSAYLFVPSRVKITLEDDAVLECPQRIPAIESFSFTAITGKKKLFTAFTDVWKKNRWMNSGQKDPLYPEEHPHPKTVVKILLKK